MAMSESFPKPVVTPYATAPDSTNALTTPFARSMRALAAGASSTVARSTETATTSSNVRECPSSTTAVGIRAMSAACEDNSRAARERRD
jgi:hypothetical protein